MLKSAKKLGQNVHQNSGVGAICPPSKILCDLGHNVLGHFVLGHFVFLGKMSPSPKILCSEDFHTGAHVHGNKIVGGHTSVVVLVRYFYSTPSTEGVKSTRGNSVCLSVITFSFFEYSII